MTFERWQATQSWHHSRIWLALPHQMKREEMRRTEALIPGGETLWTASNTARRSNSETATGGVTPELDPVYLHQLHGESLGGSCLGH